MKISNRILNWRINRIALKLCSLTNHHYEEYTDSHGEIHLTCKICGTEFNPRTHEVIKVPRVSIWTGLNKR